jgi:hypothetical protein
MRASSDPFPLLSIRPVFSLLFSLRYYAIPFFFRAFYEA